MSSLIYLAEDFYKTAEGRHLYEMLCLNKQKNLSPYYFDRSNKDIKNKNLQDFNQFINSLHEVIEENEIDFIVMVTRSKGELDDLLFLQCAR